MKTKKTDAAQTWTYRMVVVTVDEYASFCAELPSGSVSAGSFDTIKKKIDEKLAFEPFEALITDSRGRMKPIYITGWGGEKTWRRFRDSKGNDYERVLLDTPDNRAKLAALLALKRKTEAAQFKARAEVERQSDALRWKTPGE